MIKIAVLASGGGTNLQALIDAWKSGELGPGVISLVISSNAEAYALKRAEQNGVEALVLSKRGYSGPEALDEAILDALASRGIDMAVLAGYLGIIGPRVLGAYRGRIINIHPSLLPSFGGKGHYGIRVHEAALGRGVKVTGATAHYVDETIDGGEIIMQEAVRVEDGDTPELLQKRVMEQAEWRILPRAAAMLANKIACEREM